MKITHNQNNKWQDEARMLGLSDDVMNWIREVILNEKQTSIDFIKKEIADMIARKKCECCDLNHVFKLSFLTPPPTAEKHYE